MIDKKHHRNKHLFKSYERTDFLVQDGDELSNSIHEISEPKIRKGSVSTKEYELSKSRKEKQKDDKPANEKEGEEHTNRSKSSSDLNDEDTGIFTEKAYKIRQNLLLQNR